MSPKAPDPAVRTALIETAARLLAEEGPSALSTRRLASEVGTSTMAVYTYFSGMDDLRHAVRIEGFDRLAAYLERVPAGDDPVAEVVELGAAYFTNAVTNPHLYRFMFMERPIDEDPTVGLGTFERLVAGVERATNAGRFRGEAGPVALQLWSMAHGVVTLYLSGLLSVEDAEATFEESGLAMMLGLSDDPAATRRSVEMGRKRVGRALAS